MPARLNHTIVWCKDKHGSSAFMAGVPGLPDAEPFTQFMVVRAANGVSLSAAVFVSTSGSEMG